MRVIGLVGVAFLVTSCIGGFFGDPAASTDYVVTGGRADRMGELVRDVASANGLELFRHRHPQPRYPYREYTNWAPGGQVSIWLTLDTRAPFLISIREKYTSTRSAKHRKITRDLETQLAQARIAFHRPTVDELLGLRSERN